MRWVVLCGLALASFGCMTTRLGDFTILTNKNVGTKVEIPSVTDVPTTEGKSELLVILFIPTGRPPVIEDALDDALEKGKGNLMVDAVVENYTQCYVLATISGVRVRGKVVNVGK